MSHTVIKCPIEWCGWEQRVEATPDYDLGDLSDDSIAASIDRVAGALNDQAETTARLHAATHDVLDYWAQIRRLQKRLARYEQGGASG